MIVRFDSTGLDTEGDFNYQNSGIIVTVDLMTRPNILGYRTYIEGTGDVRIETGDYLIAENGIRKVVKVAQYQSSVQLKRIVVREVATELMESIIDGFEALPAAFTDLRKLSILNTVQPVLNMIVANKLQAANRIAAVIPTNADYTTGVRTQFLLLIQTAVNKL